ncbi:microtubule-associated protein Jupiter isoform X1 [Chironomus tepperi]|uniref:microtubule-associated protein Jupiter isoform X1 n=1 Tax=Chironomus tepperi TaxID=113505 RepID=UPI00391F7187
MATYAAFKHVELYNIGSGKKRVLKPPGGGSSDIFSGDVQTTPRSIKNHMKSNIFSAPSPTSKNGDARRQHVDSHNRLFGDVDRMSTPAKNHFKSSIPIGGEEGVDGSTKHSNGGHYDQENGMNGKHAVQMSSKSDISKSSISENGSTNHQILKNRVPPGGFASALW